MNFKDSNIYFIGIGGIGISGLALYLQAQGANVSGSDIKDSHYIKSLRDENIKINIPHNPANIDKNIDLVIHSAIINDKNCEIIRAKELGIKILSRKEALKIILNNNKVISVCGAHGKSTITAMLCAMLPDFSSIIGAVSKEINSNVRAKKSDFIIFEADESDASFLNSNPLYAIVPNAEPEHMEHYCNDLNSFYTCYRDFLDSAKFRIINTDDPFLQNYQNTSEKLVPQKDISEVKNLLKDGMPYSSFKLRDLGTFEVFGLGDHNVINASLGILCARNFLPLEQIRRNLLNFKGIKKRFDILQSHSIVRPLIIDDYGHHPTEIRATLQALNKYLNLYKTQYGINLKITCIFQPHKYSRFLQNQEAFIECFRGVDELIILPVWAAGEEKIEIPFLELYSEFDPLLADNVKREGEIIIVENIKNSSTKSKTLKDGCIIGFGAGDITYQLRGQ